jgi:hypothetical protein
MRQHPGERAIEPDGDRRHDRRPCERFEEGARARAAGLHHDQHERKDAIVPDGDERQHVPLEQAGRDRIEEDLEREDDRPDAHEARRVGLDAAARQKLLHRQGAEEERRRTTRATPRRIVVVEGVPARNTVVRS